MKADYSFVITVRDRQRLLDRCLKSVLWQDYPEYEVVVVDCGSEPKVSVPGDQRIRVVRLEPEEDGKWNGSVALNAGIANARADKLVLLNCDCIIAPDMLSSADAIVHADNHGKLQLYWRRFNLTPSGQRLIDRLGRSEIVGMRAYFRGILPLVAFDLGRWSVIPSYPHSERRLKVRVHDSLAACGLRKEPVRTHYPSYGDFLVVEKAPLIELGGFDERMTGWGYMDVDMMERLRRLGYQEFWCTEFKLIHQFHPPQTGQAESVKRNTELSLQDLAMGALVRNGGVLNFEKYLHDPSTSQEGGRPSTTRAGGALDE